MATRFREWELTEVAPDVQITAGAAFWTVRSGANAPRGHVEFSSASRGEFLYESIVPFNIAAVPSLGLSIYGQANSSATTTNYLLYAKTLNVRSGQATEQASSSWQITTETSFAANGAAYRQAQYYLGNSLGLAARSILRVVIGRNAASTGDDVGQSLEVPKVTALAYVDDTV